MKKLTSLLLCIALAFTLCACGDKPSGTGDDPENTTSSFARGVLTDGKYENESLGVGWNIDDTWVLADDEEIAQIMGTTKDQLSDTVFAETIENGGTVCDLYAQNEDFSTLNLQIQKFDNFLTKVAASKLSDQELIDQGYEEMIKDGYDKAIFNALGISNGELTKGTTKFAGNDRPCLKLSGVFETEEGDIPFYETMVYVVSGKYMGTFTVGTYIDDTADSVFSNFYFM